MKKHMLVSILFAVLLAFPSCAQVGDLPDDPAVSIGDLLTIPLAGFDGAEVTVLRIDPLDDPMPVARGIVEQDAAALEPLTEVGAGDTLQISVRLENGVGDSVQVVLQ